MAHAIPVIMLITAAVGTAASVYGQVKAGEAEEEARDREAQQLRASAEQAKRAAAQKVEDTRKKHAMVMAAQRARYAASGMAIDEGSPLLVQMESVAESEEELRRIKEEGEIQANAYLASAGEAEAQGKAAATSGYVKAIGAATEGFSTIERIGRNYQWWGTE